MITMYGEKHDPDRVTLQDLLEQFILAVLIIGAMLLLSGSMKAYVALWLAWCGLVWILRGSQVGRRKIKIASEMVRR
jgi:hypothetical protein